MTIIDCIGFTGVLMILIAYFLNLKEVLKTDTLTYILLNLIGASLACLASVLMNYLPFVLLEGVWTMVSLNALVKYLGKERIKRREQFRRLNK